MPNLEMTDSKVTEKKATSGAWEDSPLGAVKKTPQRVLIFSSDINSSGFWFAYVMTPCLPDIFLFPFSLLAFQSAQIVIPLAITVGLSSKGSIQMKGTKGTEVTTPGFGHSMAQKPAPSKMLYRPLELGTKVLLTRSLLCWV